MSYLTRQISRSLQLFYIREETSNKQMCFQFLAYQITLFEYTVTYFLATLISLFYIFNLFPPYRFTRNLRICKCNFMTTVKSELYLLLMPLKPDPFLTLSNNLLRLILRIVKYKLKCCEYIKNSRRAQNKIGKINQCFYGNFVLLMLYGIVFGMSAFTQFTII